MELAPASTLPLPAQQFAVGPARKQTDLARAPAGGDGTEETVADDRPPHLKLLGLKRLVGTNRTAPLGLRGAVGAERRAAGSAGALCRLDFRPDPAVAGVAPLEPARQILGFHPGKVVADKARKLEERLQAVGDQRLEVGRHGLVHPV